MNLSERKKALRQRVLADRDAMTPVERADASKVLTGLLTANERYRQAGSVLAYWGFGSELDTHAFLKAALTNGKMLALPRIDKASNSLQLYRVKDLDADLEAGPWGIREPKKEPARLVTLDKIEFVLVPGVAFDAACNRMGYGKAYYDRLFADCKGRLPFRSAAAFDCQIVDAVPVSPSDVPIDAVFAPKRVFTRARSS